MDKVAVASIDDKLGANGGQNLLSQSPAKSQESSQDEKNCTPKPFRHRRLDCLIGAECKSPVLKIPSSPLLERIGYGTGVGVYLLNRSPRGEIRSPWAIKKVAKMRQARSTMYADRLELEASILKELCHPNIIGYRAFVKPLNDSAFLAMEKASMSLADLTEARFDEATVNSDATPDPFSAAKITKVGHDIAKALDYLHNEKRILHGDLKSGNVLIFGDFETVKLCDFGVARKIKHDGTLEGEYVGTEIWTPMEVIAKQRNQPHAPITSKADIYPFGLTLYEMISCKPPHLPTADDHDGTDEESFDEEAFEDNLAQLLGTRPFLPDMEYDASYHTILALFFCCTEEDPSKRPTATDILKVFVADCSEEKLVPE